MAVMGKTKKITQPITNKIWGHRVCIHVCVPLKEGKENTETDILKLAGSVLQREETQGNIVSPAVSFKCLV